MSVTDIEVWLGWGRLAARESWPKMPVWVEQAVSRGCEKPEHSWNMLVSISTEREALFTGERLPKEVLGISTSTIDQAALHLERQATHFAMSLAWGDYDDEW